MPIKGLSAQKFQHPYDEEATRALRRLPGLEFGARSLTPVLEETIYLDNIANSVLVNEEQLPSIFALLVEACSILDMPTVPELYVRQNPVPNAYTLAINGKKPFMVLTSSLVDLMNREELQAVIAHELGHLKCEHGVWVTTANVIAQGLYSTNPNPPAHSTTQHNTIQYNTALPPHCSPIPDVDSCDRASLLVVQDLNVVVSTLLKLVGGSVSTAKELSVEAFLKQASTYEVASRSRLGRLLSNSQADELSHPLPVVRAKELEKWSRSLTYMKLVRRTDQLNRLQKN
ncbi:unnamed protein product [Chrysoparadoxa australica]